MKTIYLKIAPEYFEAQKAGKKKFEIRRNDRDFQVGDKLKLCEWNDGYTGRDITVRIEYMTDYKQKPGYVVLGTKAVSYEIMKYRKIALIEAEQFDGSDEMIEKYDVDVESIEFVGKYYTLLSVNGDMNLYIGDWIATGTQHEHWVIRDDIFGETYEPVKTDK